jgi:adenylosuccinate lyase
VLRVREALKRVRGSLSELLSALADRVEEWADLPAMAYTHLQPAEPTTIGYRLAQYAQDLLFDLDSVDAAHRQLRGKGLKGAVGTSASYAHLLQGTGHATAELEAAFMGRLDLAAVPVATQVYPRKQDLVVLNALAGLAASLHKMAFDLRVLQSPPFGEMAEPFGSKQVGSSAMPFKRNPINSEKICSLARHVAALPPVAWQNAANCLLERTLDDSANRRVILPEAFLATDEMLRTELRIVQGWRVEVEGVARTLATYGVFAATEALLMEAVRAGADRQVMHETIRGHSLHAWAALQRGETNPLVEQLSSEPAITHWVSPQRARELLDSRDHLGDAAERARSFAAAIRARLQF